MSIIIKANGVDVTTAAPLPVGLTTDKTKAGIVVAANQISDGAARVDGSGPYNRHAAVSEYRRLRVGVDTWLFGDTHNNTTMNTNNWKQLVASAASTLSGGFFNMVGNLAAANGTVLQTARYFSLAGSAQLTVKMSLMFAAVPSANTTLEFGLFTVGTTPFAPNDGVYFRIIGASCIGVITYNGVDIVTTSQIPLPTEGETHSYRIVVCEDEVEWWIDGTFYSEKATPAAYGQPFMQGSLPLTYRLWNTGIPALAQTMKIADSSVYLHDFATNKPWSHQLASAGQSCGINQNGHALVLGGTPANMGNGVTLTAVTPTNTTVAVAGLGGIIAWNMQASAVTDFIICSYLNPAASNVVSGKVLQITGVKISSAVMTALTNAAISLIGWSLCYGGTALTMVPVTEAVGTVPNVKNYRRKALGFQSLPATAAVGVIATPDVQLKFDSPISVNPGEYIAIVAKCISGTAVGALVSHIDFDGYFE